MIKKVGFIILAHFLFTNCKKSNNSGAEITIQILNEITKEPLSNIILEVDIIHNYSWGMLASNKRIFDLKTDSKGIAKFKIVKGEVYYLWIKSENVNSSELIETKYIDLSKTIFIYFKYDSQKIQL